MSARPVTKRNPRTQLRPGDIVASYGNGRDLVLAAEPDGDAVQVLDLDTMRARWHSTPCAASDLLARGINWIAA